MTTRHDEGSLARKSTTGPDLYFYATSPEGKPGVVVGLLHGYAEHGKRYAHVADAWAERGIATVAIDMRGHGRAGGRRGHCDRFDEFLDDAAELTSLVAGRAPGVPAVLFGHSFGGLVAASAAMAKPAPWRALALSGPFFAVGRPVPRAKVIAGKLAARLVPTLAMPSGLSGKDVTHDAERARAYDEDPLVFKTATARWFTETTAAQDRAVARAASLTMPLLLVIGLADHVVSVPRAREFFDAAGSADKTWDGREGLFHEVLNEPEWRPIADRIAEWVTAHAR
ncbi:MAG TPA: lysophospholipase [Polyangiaceae bacterium]|jgi:alpha-beta hydrolase superfamily lysophospholipase